MEKINIEEIFAQNVFTRSVMEQYLPKDAYEEVIRVMEHGGELSRETANVELGNRKRCDPLYSLVPAFDRIYGREA